MSRIFFKWSKPILQSNPVASDFPLLNSLIFQNANCLLFSIPLQIVHHSTVQMTGPVSTTTRTGKTPLLKESPPCIPPWSLTRTSVSAHLSTLLLLLHVLFFSGWKDFCQGYMSKQECHLNNLQFGSNWRWGKPLVSYCRVPRAISFLLAFIFCPCSFVV